MFTEENRLSFGASDNLLLLTEESNQEAYCNFLRMTPEMFERLLLLVGKNSKIICSSSTNFSNCTVENYSKIHKATGDNIHSLRYLFKVSLSCIVGIIKETSIAIWAYNP